MDALSSWFTQNNALLQELAVNNAENPIEIDCDEVDQSVTSIGEVIEIDSDGNDSVDLDVGCLRPPNSIG
jgi:hypothetical protein